MPPTGEVLLQEGGADKPPIACQIVQGAMERVEPAKGMAGMRIGRTGLVLSPEVSPQVNTTIEFKTQVGYSAPVRRIFLYQHPDNYNYGDQPESAPLVFLDADPVAQARFASGGVDIAVTGIAGADPTTQASTPWPWAGPNVRGLTISTMVT
jgi:hypothetical protein